VEQELNEQVYQGLIERTEFELPDSMVEYELNNIIDEIEKTLTYYNKTMEEQGLTKEMLVEEHRKTAEKKVRRHLIKQAIKLIIKNSNIEEAKTELKKKTES